MIELGEQNGYEVNAITEDIPKGSYVWIDPWLVCLTYNAITGDFRLYGKPVLNPADYTGKVTHVSQPRFTFNPDLNR